FEQRAVVRGDATSAAIAAASIVAKVTRDRYMVRAGESFPGWGFEDHFGYSTAAHREAIAALVASPRTTARCSKSISGTSKPSARQRQPGTATDRSASRRAAMLVLCRPRSSIERTDREITATREAVAITMGKSASRSLALCC
ncbi:MAG: hypothetical protein ACKOTH_10435, partial [Solirubrobacterales bacterium]